MIIGCCGAGKSTLAKKVHERTDLPLVHLDQLFWKPNWTEPSTEEWEGIVEKASDEATWIMDGNYGGTMDIRLNKADTVVFLNRPTWLCLFRVFKRVALNYGKTRFDMPDGCRERFDFDFLKYVYHYNKTRRDKILNKLEVIKREKQVFVLNNENEISNFLSQIEQHEKHL